MIKLLSIHQTYPLVCTPSAVECCVSSVVDCGLGAVTVHTAHCGPNSYKQIVIAIACSVQCVYVFPVVWHVVSGYLLISAKSLAPGGGYCACSVDMCEQ
jgi:hypothetical protein